jgi:hypothetical protein
MNVIHLMKKGGPMNILESFFIYIATKNNNQINNKSRVLKNALFNMIIMGDDNQSPCPGSTYIPLIFSYLMYYHHHTNAAGNVNHKFNTTYIAIIYFHPYHYSLKIHFVYTTVFTYAQSNK